jgi:hypothetical protein
VEGALKLKIIHLKDKLEKRDRLTKELEYTLHHRCEDLQTERKRMRRLDEELVKLQSTNRGKKEIEAALKELGEKLQYTKNNKKGESGLLGKMKKLVAVVMWVVVSLIY